MTHDALRAAFIYGLSRLQVDDDAITDDTNPADMAAVLRLAKQLYCGLGDDTPHDLALSRLLSLTGALIVGRVLGIRRKNLGREWLSARGEALELRLAAD